VALLVSVLAIPAFAVAVLPFVVFAVGVLLARGRATGWRYERRLGLRLLGLLSCAARAWRRSLRLEALLVSVVAVAASPIRSVVPGAAVTPLVVGFGRLELLLHRLGLRRLFDLRRLLHFGDLFDRWRNRLLRRLAIVALLLGWALALVVLGAAVAAAI